MRSPQHKMARITSDCGAGLLADQADATACGQAGHAWDPPAPSTCEAPAGRFVSEAQVRRSGAVFISILFYRTRNAAAGRRNARLSCCARQHLFAAGLQPNRESLGAGGLHPRPQVEKAFLFRCLSLRYHRA